MAEVIARRRLGRTAVASHRRPRQLRTTKNRRHGRAGQPRHVALTPRRTSQLDSAPRRAPPEPPESNEVIPDT